MAESGEGGVSIGQGSAPVSTGQPSELEGLGQPTIDTTDKKNNRKKEGKNPSPTEEKSKLKKTKEEAEFKSEFKLEDNKKKGTGQSVENQSGQKQEEERLQEISQTAEQGIEDPDEARQALEAITGQDVVLKGVIESILYGDATLEDLGLMSFYLSQLTPRQEGRITGSLKERARINQIKNTEARIRHQGIPKEGG